MSMCKMEEGCNDQKMAGELASSGARGQARGASDGCAAVREVHIGRIRGRRADAPFDAGRVNLPEGGKGRPVNAIKVKVDHDNSRGQYLITGSSNLHFVKEVSDSLAGRLGRVRLRTMTLGELKGGAGDFLQRAFARDFPQTLDKFDKRAVIHCAFCGGYPEPLEFSVRSRKAWYREYLDDLLRKDIRDMTEIRKLDSLRKVAHWLLAYSSKFFEMKDMCAASGIGKETADTYLSALMALYVFDGVSPWSDSDYAKLGKRTKYYAADAGLTAS